MDSEKLSYPRFPSPPQALAVVLGGLGLILWHAHFAFIQFGGLDGGFLINTAWVQYEGLLPYRDFTTALPPLFVYPAGWAFELAGPNWTSLTALVCGFSVFTYLWTFSLLWRAIGEPWKALLFALILQAITFLPLSWWWYNAITAVIESIYFGSVFALLLRPKDAFFRTSFWCALALTAMVKANTAGPLLISTLLLLLTFPSLRKFVLVATLSTAAIDALFLAINHVSPVLVLQNYLLYSTRLHSLKSWIICMYGYGSPELFRKVILESVLMAALVAYVLVNKRLLHSTKHYPTVLWLLISAMMTCLFSMMTNSDLKCLDIACLLMIVPFLHRLIKDPEPKMAFRQAPLLLIYVILAFFVCDALWIGTSRLRVASMGKYFFFDEEHSLRQQNEPPLFRGISAGPVLENTVADLREALQENHALQPTAQKVFFGPRIDFGYAAFNLPFTKGLPIFWENVPAYSSVVRDTPENHLTGPSLDPRVACFIQTRFDICLFLSGYRGEPDMPFLPEPIIADLRKNYHVEGRDRIFIFTRIKP